MSSRFALHILIETVAGHRGTPFDQTFYSHHEGEGIFIHNGPPNLRPGDSPVPTTATETTDRQEVQITLYGFPATFLLFRRSNMDGAPWIFNPPAEVLQHLSSEEGDLVELAEKPLSLERPLRLCFKGTAWRLTATVQQLPG